MLKEFPRIFCHLQFRSLTYLSENVSDKFRLQTKSPAFYLLSFWAMGMFMSFPWEEKWAQIFALLSRTRYFNKKLS